MEYVYVVTDLLQFFKCLIEREVEKKPKLKLLSVQSLIDCVGSFPKTEKGDLRLSALQFVHSHGICLHEGYTSSKTCERKTPSNYFPQFTLRYIGENDETSIYSALYYGILAAKITPLGLRQTTQAYHIKNVRIEVSIYQCQTQSQNVRSESDIAYDVLIFGYDSVLKYFKIVHNYGGQLGDGTGYMNI